MLESAVVKDDWLARRGGGGRAANWVRGLRVGGGRGEVAESMGSSDGGEESGVVDAGRLGADLDFVLQWGFWDGDSGFLVVICVVGIDIDFGFSALSGYVYTSTSTPLPRSSSSAPAPPRAPSTLTLLPAFILWSYISWP